MDYDKSKGSTLVSLNAHRAARRHTAVNQVEAYWEGLRRNRLVPSRADVDPRGLSGSLEHAFVLERIAPGLARFRVAGMHLSDLMGLEVRGMPVSAIFTPDARAQLAKALEAAFTEPATIRLALMGEDGVGRPTLEGEMVILPLRSDGGEITRALGCVVMEGQIGRQPRRLMIRDVEHKTLIGYGESGSSAPSPATTEDQASTGFAEPEAPYAPRPRSGSRPRLSSERPHLRLIHSRD
ncbi:MAG: PAS domain-containing protein [Pseudomonadota bacterium]